MHPFVNIATKAARLAGRTMIRSMDELSGLTIVEKKTHDYATQVDRLCEKQIVETIRKAYPEHSILAEETGLTQGQDGSVLWIIDPLDGTTNYIHGFPQFAVSIAIKSQGRLEHGVIYDPVKDELFTASRGQGAQLNGTRLRVSQNKEFNKALIGTGFPYREFSYLDNYMAILKELFENTAGIRRAGAASLDLAYVAAGRLDGFFEYNLSQWDMAAGAVIVKEAGGMISDFSGDETYLETGNIVVGNPKIFKELLIRIKKHA